MKRFCEILILVVICMLPFAMTAKKSTHSKTKHEIAKEMKVANQDLKDLQQDATDAQFEAAQAKMEAAEDAVEAGSEDAQTLKEAAQAIADARDEAAQARNEAAEVRKQAAVVRKQAAEVRKQAAYARGEAAQARKEASQDAAEAGRDAAEEFNESAQAVVEARRDNILDKISDMDGVTTVYLTKPMLRSLVGRTISGQLSHSSSGINLGNIVGSLNSLQILSVDDNKSLVGKVRDMLQDVGNGLDLLMKMKDSDGSKTVMYGKKVGDVITYAIMIVDDKDEINIISFSGEVTMKALGIGDDGDQSYNIISPLDLNVLDQLQGYFSSNEWQDLQKILENISSKQLFTLPDLKDFRQMDFTIGNVSVHSGTTIHIGSCSRES
ncbi:MAG: DUF4252 domain-containing protein [Muribaculaceae bacterium]|jgi:hypothetical protein|nr:DUF4252 domain-containing protein [Muribaculaceae bacterium]